MQVLLGKKALVTGASRGVGRIIAEMLASHGADVVISYCSDRQGADETLQRMLRYQRLAKAFCADFSQGGSVVSFYRKAEEVLGQIDLLVNCAAAYDTHSFIELKPKQYELLFQVGPIASMELMQQVSLQMIEKKIEGSIVNISSIAANRPYLNRTAHCGAKAALDMLTRSAALELAPYKIRVNGIAPGSIGNEQTAGGVKLQDIASATLFLVSSKSPWLTGQVLPLDGA